MKAIDRTTRRLKRVPVFEVHTSSAPLHTDVNPFFEFYDDFSRFRMLAETGRISEDEYVQLKSELIAADTSPDAFEETASAPVDAPPHPEVQAAPEPAPTTPEVYHGALWVGVASIFLGSTFGLVAWAAIVVSIYALTTSKVKRSRWMPWTGLVLGAIYGYINLYLNGHVPGL